MLSKVEIYDNYEEVPSIVYEFVKKNALVQHYPIIGESFSAPYYFYYFVSYYKGKVNAIFPLIIFKKKDKSVAYSLPFFSYAGIVGEESGVRAIESRVVDFLKQSNIVTLSYCHHPFLNYHRVDFDFEFRNFYQYIELTSKSYISNMNSKSRNNLRRNLKKAKSFNIELIESTNTHDLNDWYYNVYVNRLKETNGPIYPFSTFQTLLKVPHQRVHFVLAKINKEIIGGAFYLCQIRSIDLFMRVIKSDYLHTQAGVLLDYYIINQAESAQYEFFNWQSADYVDSPVFNYKRSWGSEVAEYSYLTKKINTIDSFKSMNIAELKLNYPGMYVAPYEVIFSEKS